MVDRPPLFKRIRRYYIGGILAISMLFLNLFIYLTLVIPAKDHLDQMEEIWQNTRKDINQKISDINSQIDRKKIYKKAMEDLDRFKALLLEQHEFSKIVDHLSVTAKRQKIGIPSISYHQEKTGKEGFKKISISFTVEGRYKDIKRFIYDLENAKDFLIIEDLGLARSGKGSDPINLQIKIATYLG